MGATASRNIPSSSSPSSASTVTMSRSGLNEYGHDLAYIHHAGFSEFAESAAPGLLEILWKHAIRDGLVVEIGCGSGILARELTRAGFDVLGFDASPAMIALARSGAPAASR